MRVGRVLAFAVLVVLAVAGCADEGTEPAEAGGGAPKEVTAGMIVPTSGALAGAAEEIVTGTEIAVETWNRFHDSPQVKLEICDDGGNPERSLTCINRLEGSVDFFLGPHFGDFWTATEQTFVDLGLFVVSGTPTAIPPADSNAFGAATPHAIAVEMAFRLYQEQGWDSVGFVAAEDATGQAAVEGARDVADELGLDLTVATFAPDSQSAVSQLETIKSADPDVVQVWTTGTTGVTVLRAARQVGLSDSVPFVMNYSNASPITYELAADVLPSDLRLIGSPSFVEGGVEDPEQGETIEAFRDAYRERSGTDVSWNALAGGDAVAVAMEAVSNGSSPEEWAAYLESGAEVPGHTVVFRYSNELHAGNQDPSTLRLVKLVDGAWQFAE